MRVLVFLLLAACVGETGTIQLELTTAPGSTVLDGVQRLRVTLTDPPIVVEAPRVDDSFDLVIDVEATGTAAVLIVEGFDEADSLVATGASPPFGVAAINARVVVYIAAPFTIGAAPVALPVARTGVASTALSYGFALAGGEQDGTPSDSIFIYNAFDHTLTAGIAMPAPKSFQTLATGGNNAVYLFGGLGSDGAPTGSLWRFDTNAQPNGAFSVGVDSLGLAREGATAIALGPERFVISGTPPINLDFGVATARTDIPALARGVGLVLGDRGIGMFVGDPVTRLEADVFETYAASTTAESTAAIVGTVAVFTTATTNLLVLDPSTAADPGSTADALSVSRQRPAIAATGQHVVVAGGTDDGGLPIASADILDAITLERITTVPCAARAGASAYALSNGQIAIVGGEPANDLIELFTPPAPR